MKVFHFATGHYQGPPRCLWGPTIGIVVAKDTQDATNQIRKTLSSDDGIWWIKQIDISKRGITEIKKY